MPVTVHVLTRGVNPLRINLPPDLTAAVKKWTAEYGDTFRIWMGHYAFVVLSKPADLEVRI